MQTKTLTQPHKCVLYTKYVRNTKNYFHQNQKTNTTPQLYCTLSTSVVCKTKTYFLPEPKTDTTQQHNWKMVLRVCTTKTYFLPEQKTDTTAQLDRSIQYKKEIHGNRKFGSYEKHILASELFL